MEVGKIREEKKIKGSKFAQNGMKYVMFGRLLFIHDNHVQARMITYMYIPHFFGNL